MLSLRFLSRSRFGRRGSILLILGGFDVIYGLALINPGHADLASPSTIWRQHYLPLWVWGGGWVIVGLVLLAQAAMHNDVLGYTLAICQKVIWGLVAITSWMFGGVERGWLIGIVWFVFAIMIAIISGWPEPMSAAENEEITHDLGPMGDGA